MAYGRLLRICYEYSEASELQEILHHPIRVFLCLTHVVWVVVSVVLFGDGDAGMR